MAIACDTAESQATGSYSQLIRALLQNVDSKFQSWSADVNMIPGALLASVDELQELFYETYALLSKYPLEEHSIMWIFYTHALSLRLLMLKQTYVSAWSDRGNSAGSGSGIGSLAGSRRNSTLHLKHLDSNFKEIGAKLLKCSNDITQLVTTVFSGDLDVYRLFQMISTNMQAFQQLYGLMQSSLAVLVVNLEQVEEMTDSKANLHAVARFLVQYYEHAKTVLLRLGVFPPLVECVKVAYKVDLPEVLLPLIDSGIINATTPLEFIENSKIDFGLLVDYYRYSAFSLLALSQKCDTYNFQSEIFFKVLLRFPNLHLSLWANIDSNNVTANSTSPINNFKFNIPSGSLPAVLEDAVAPNMKSPYIALGEYTPPPPTLGQLPSSCILSIEERQEVSLLYIINYLLRISSLVELVNPSTTFNQELNFLIANLLTNLSLFIQKSVSVVSMYLTLQDDDRSSSAGSGAGNVNLSDTSVMCKSISSILFHGTYKERLTGVINFLESIRKDTIHIPTILSRYLPLDSFNGDEMAVESDFERLATNIDDVKYPGKIKYIDVIHRIACRIRSVSFCHWLKTSGVNNIPEHQLKRFYYSDAEQVVTDSFLQKAKALQFRLGRSEKILEVKQVQLNEVNIGKNILEQLEIHRANAQLDSSSSRLTNYIK